MRRVASMVCAALASVALTGTPAAAQAPSADVAIQLVSAKVELATVNPNSGLFKGDTGIGYVTVVVRTHNFGPENTADTSVVKDITAPPGTVFRQLDEKYFAQYPGLCTVVTAHTHVRCKVNGSIWLDTYNGGSGGNTSTQYFVLKKKCVSPGRYRLDYAGDPKTSNNSISIALKVPGVTAATCAKPKPSPTRTATSPKPAVAASPAAPSASPSPTLASPSPSSASPTVSESPSETIEPSPSTIALAASESSTLNSGIVLGGIGALAAVALVAGFWLYARHRSTETS
ncbi:hypothetical protein [Catellatospora paridis]|uniref:hypothetical protein n=1 Tax=Catellatospora paridis TaxID=1617086 RepID=UPI0012D3819C|nr:hypothetical protein [Catellatospora paridis]